MFASINKNLDAHRLLFNLQNNAGGTAEITTQLRGQWRLILFSCLLFSVKKIKTQEYRKHSHTQTYNKHRWLINAGSSFKISQHQAKGFCAHAGVCILRVCEREKGGWEDWGWSSSLSQKSICPFNQTAGAKTHDPHILMDHTGEWRGRCAALHPFYFGEALCFLVRAMTFVTAKMGWKWQLLFWIKTLSIFKAVPLRFSLKKK